MKNSYTNIAFPFFGLKKKPFSIQYTRNGMTMIVKDGDDPIPLDVKDFEKEGYLDRLVELRKYTEEPMLFDFTARSVEELIHTKCNWGIDSKGNVFDLFKKKKVKVKYKRVRQVAEDVLWVQGISYPFKIPKYLADVENLKNIWVGIVRLEFYYVIYDYDYFPQHNKETLL
jgi:hypothetical protein